ncbi:uncharacterized protein BDV17DRAFT_203936 [Aspergillus undulatus]|uniref:uncharacterized protein n=1 Tax=Aspergillus undulatus TaxID=1810928 RepID=UPI003CCD6B78
MVMGSQWIRLNSSAADGVRSPEEVAETMSNMLGRYLEHKAVSRRDYTSFDLLECSNKLLEMVLCWGKDGCCGPSPEPLVQTANMTNDKLTTFEDQCINEYHSCTYLWNFRLIWVGCCRG